MGFLAAVMVKVILDGRLIESLLPAMLVHGTVVAPVDPYLRDIADEIDIDAGRHVVRFVRGEHEVQITLGTRSVCVNDVPQTLPVAPYWHDGRVMIPLAAVTRALGEYVAYDAAYQNLSIISSAPMPVATRTPYAAPSWRPSPGPTFTPPARPTPQPTVSGVPQPRRTPIPVLP
ncbi:MAG TPA: copper amine oxidase N-terminal domain-containing protein [Candidatus Acidoferrales bacterium]|nr:copper amine oxidase N-terminal domain-containing protein [Candidatus Acidoferrales bacterium]